MIIEVNSVILDNCDLVSVVIIYSVFIFSLCSFLLFIQYMPLNWISSHLSYLWS